MASIVVAGSDGYPQSFVVTKITQSQFAIRFTNIHEIPQSMFYANFEAIGY